MPFPHLIQYLSGSNGLAAVQFVVFVAVFALLVDRAVRAVGWLGRPLACGEPVANAVVDGLTQFCVGLGLLLTFSGLYGYIGSGQGDDQAALLMALGSSALGYSAWTLCSAAAVVDGWRGVAAKSEPLDGAPARRGMGFGSDLDSEGDGRSSYDSARGLPSHAVGDARRARGLDWDGQPLSDGEDDDSDEGDQISDEDENDDIGEETFDEQETIGDPGGWGGFMGGAAGDADPATARGLGGLDGYQRPLGGGDRFGGGAGADLGPRRAAWPVAGDGPAADAGSSPPLPGGNGRPKPHAPGGPPVV